MSDLISRKDVIDAVESRYAEVWEDSDVDYNNGIEAALCEIKALPSAERTGWWVDDNGRPYNGKPNGSCWCGECGEWLVASDEYACSTSYCPNCGVRMLNGGE